MVRINAIRGFKNIDASIIAAGTGITYGEKPVGKTTPIVHIIIDSTAASDKYRGSLYDFSKNCKYDKKIMQTSNTNI